MRFFTSKISISRLPKDVLRSVESHFGALYPPIRIEELGTAEIRWRIGGNRFTVRCVRIGDPTVLANVKVLPAHGGASVLVNVGLPRWTGFAFWAIVLLILTCWGGCSFFNFVAEYSQDAQNFFNGMGVLFLGFATLWYWSTRHRAKPVARIVYDYVLQVLTNPSDNSTSNGEKHRVQS